MNSRTGYLKRQRRVTTFTQTHQKKKKQKKNAIRKETGEITSKKYKGL